MKNTTLSIPYDQTPGGGKGRVRKGLLSTALSVRLNLRPAA